MSKQPTKLTVEERVSPKKYQELYQKGYRAGFASGEANSRVDNLTSHVALDNLRLQLAEADLEREELEEMLEHRYALSTVVWTFVFGMVFALVIAIAALR